jgi:plastocyanin
MFGILGWRGSDPRLAMAGARGREGLLGRLFVLVLVALGLVALFAPQILVRSADLVADPAVFVLGLTLMALVSVPLGLAIRALVPRELDGTLVLVGVVGVETTIPHDISLAAVLPLWGPLEVMQIGVGRLDGPIAGAVVHAAVSALLLLAVAALAVDPSHPHPLMSERTVMTAVAERPAPHLEADQPRAGDRFVAVGLLLLAAVFLGMQLLHGVVIPPVAIPMMLYAAAGTVLLRRRPRWLPIATVALAVLHLAASMPFLVPALSHPETPPSFLPEALAVILVAMLAAGVVVPARRRALAWVAGAFAAAALLVSFGAAAAVESDGHQPGDVPIEVLRVQFPALVEVPAGVAVLWVDNQDPFRHTFVIEGTAVHSELPGSTAVRVETDLALGTYRYYCDVPGHEDMDGELVVR